MNLKSLPAILALASAIGAQTLPTDAKATCTVPAATFKTWFASGSVAVNGVVNPANSVTFTPNSLCSFYQWSEQMFLWLTSPTPSIYGGGPRIFDSGVFFDVTPLDSNGNRTLVQHTSQGRVLPFPVRFSQAGPHGLPVVRDTAGVFHEVELPKISAAGNQVIHDSAGNAVEIGKATVVGGKPVLLDTAGKTLNLSSLLKRPAVQARLVSNLSSVTLQKITVGSSIFFIGSGGSIVPVEQNQADDMVLESQKNGLIYFATIVNDVYAYFSTGLLDHKLTGTSFPTTAAQLAAIVAFAKTHGTTFPDPNALAVEIKSSWVDASGLANLGSYITVQGTVPTYNTSNPKDFKATGTKTIQLALVGMHVVGTVQGHPEMIWATFEHVGNTPLATYSYTNTTGATKTVAQSTAGTWLFSKTGSSGPFNVAHMQQSGSDITALGTFNVSPSDTIRFTPFGSFGNAAGAASNTDILAINNSIRSQLTAADIRSNYVFSGAVWTLNGASPSAPGTTQAGTIQLTNSTMETYEQGTSNTAASSNCLSCHALNTTGTSHVFSAIKTPLF